MDYTYFIKNLPLDIVEIINSFCNPKSEYYTRLLKEKVKKFCLNGMMRIEDCGIRINNSYFQNEQFEEEKFKINIDTRINEILRVRDTFKIIFKPMKKKVNISYYLKNVVEEIGETYVSNGIMIMALILLGVKYKKKYVQDTNPLFYCSIKNTIKKIIKPYYILDRNSIKKIKENLKI